MSVIRQLPRGTFFRPVLNSFQADFNTPSVGLYDFAVAANTEQEVMKLNSSSLYFIGLMNFGTTVSESAYFENLSLTPKINLFTKQGNAQIFGAAYGLANYLVNNEIASFFWTDKPGDTLVATMTGQLGQNASLSGITEIVARISMNVYEVTDIAFINEFFQRKTDPANLVQLPTEFQGRF